MKPGQDKELLCGWKEIEAYLGIAREAATRNGFPVHKCGGAVFAIPDELLEHVRNMPRLGSPTAGQQDRKG